MLEVKALREFDDSSIEIGHADLQTVRHREFIREHEKFIWKRGSDLEGAQNRISHRYGPFAEARKTNIKFGDRCLRARHPTRKRALMSSLDASEKTCS